MSGQIGEPEYFSYLPVEMLDHALIEPGPVSVVASVHLVVVVGMGELKQSAATGLTRALDELQRPFGHSLLPGRWEDPRESLHTQIENLEELAVSADTALLHRPMHERAPWGIDFHLEPGRAKEPRNRHRPSCARAPRSRSRAASPTAGEPLRSCRAIRRHPLRAPGEDRPRRACGNRVPDGRTRARTVLSRNAFRRSPTRSRRARAARA